MCISIMHLFQSEYTIGKKKGFENMKLHERYSTLSPIYSGGLTNHLPMMITALRLLDVEENRIEMISKEYVENKNIVDLSNTLIENDPFSDEYIRLTNYYLQEFKHHGIEQTMHLVLNGNRYSLHSGLFHGMIRIAYAYLENDELLIAQGLAYFDMIKQELKLQGNISTDIFKDFKKLVAIRKAEVRITKDGTTNKLNTLLECEAVTSHLFYSEDAVKYKDQALQLFVEYFNKTKDFYILHAITGYHALHILSQFFDNEEEVFQNFFMQGLLIMLIHPHDSYLEPVEEKYGFVHLAQQVPNLRDAHDIKLFYSLAYFYERYDVEGIKNAINLVFV